MKRTNEVLAYLAGILDGEGHIGIKRLQPSRRNREKNICHQSRVMVRMTNPQPGKLLKRVFGGSFYREKKVCNPLAKKLLYVWEVRHQQAGEVCNQLKPWLRVKRGQANLALLLQLSKQSTQSNRYGPNRLTKEILRYRDRLWSKCRELNH